MIQSKFRGITVIGPSQSIELDQLPSRDEEQKVYVCDSYVKGIEVDGRPIVGGFRLGESLFNIDHHAPVKRMQRLISSTPLAIEHLEAFGPIPQDAQVVINHLDADSVLSSAIIRGLLSPESRFAEAAIKADHTGEADKIADLLQACGQTRRLDFCWRNLQLLLEGKPVEPDAEKLLDKRLAERQLAERLVDEGCFTTTKHGVAWVHLLDKVDGVFFPALLPEAKVIVGAIAIEGSDRTRIGCRLGQAAPKNGALDDLDIPSFDSAYGGRWNAGNNSRAGGTDIPLEGYIQELDKRVQQHFT